MKKLSFHESYSVDENSGCWNWIRYVNPNGYGMVNVRDEKHNRHRWAHRVSYEQHVGPIPAGLVVDHICRNTKCVNPEHLQVTTQKENIRLGFERLGRTNGWWHKLKTHCPKGHEYTAENTYIKKKGSRACRTCVREAMRAYRAAA